MHLELDQFEAKLTKSLVEQRTDAAIKAIASEARNNKLWKIRRRDVSNEALSAMLMINYLKHRYLQAPRRFHLIEN